MAFLPHPYLLGAPTLPAMVGKGLIFPNPKIEHHVFGLGKSKHSHFWNMLMDSKDHRTRQEVLTWAVTIALNNSRRGSEVGILS